MYLDAGMHMHILLYVWRGVCVGVCYMYVYVVCVLCLHMYVW